MVFPKVDIKERREWMGLSLSELAEQSGMTKSHLCKVECGHAPITAFLAQSISKPLHCPWFLFFDEHESLKYWGEIQKFF